MYDNDVDEIILAEIANELSDEFELWLKDCDEHGIHESEFAREWDNVDWN